MTDALIDLAAPALDELAASDPAAAVERHFGPVVVRSLPPTSISSGDCSVDGFYECSVDPTTPWILFSSEVAPERAQFTILHELGHHLLNTTGVTLLDDIDRLGEIRDGAIKVEETICHRFAGRVLVPQDLVSGTFKADVPSPPEIVTLHDRSFASWEAVAIRAAEAARRQVAVVLIRDEGEVAFAASSSRLTAGWARGSPVSPGGPLSRALATARQSAIKDVFRWELAFASQLYCDTLRVHPRLAVAVLSDVPSDGRFDILGDVEPAWKTKEEFCDRCGDERSVGWCDGCAGRFCSGCGSCGCSKPVANEVCPQCFLANPRNPGSEMCVDCERDLS